MTFFDLNIPYLESDRHATDVSTLRGRRLKLALKTMELGYTGVAYNRILKGVMSESHRCSTTLFPLSKLIPSSSSFFAAVKLHRDLLNVAVSSPFRQYTRLTVIVDIPSQVSALNAGNPILRSYDVVAVRPMNQNAFDQACQTSKVDMISIDFTEKLPFRLKQPMVKAAIKRGVFFEITYSGLIVDAQSRRQMISNCKLLVDWTSGKNLIFSSAAPSATELRGPLDVANLFSLLGLPVERAKAAISKNCRSLLANALRKKQFKEAVKLEKMPSMEQVNPERSVFDDCLKCDSISRGDGDLLLGEMEKSFSLCITTNKTVKTINFTSTMNGLPAHGLQIKDLISVTMPAVEPPDVSNLACNAMETEEDDEVSKKAEDQNALNYTGNYTNSEETMSISAEKLSYSNDFEANLFASETQFIQSQNYGENYLPDDGRVHRATNEAECTTPIFDNNISVKNFGPLIKSSLSGFQLERPYVENRYDVGLCAQEGLKLDRVRDKIENEDNKGPSLASCDVSSLDVNVEEEQNREMANLPIDEIFDLKTNLDEPISEDVMMDEAKHLDFVTSYQGLCKSLAGRDKRRRNPSHQSLLVPFKRFLKPRPFRRKA